MTSFSAFLGDTSLASQNVFSKEYTAWLSGVVLDDPGVIAWLQTQLDDGQLEAFQQGEFKVELNQNSTDGAPYLTFGELGSYALTDLFSGDKSSMEWTKGKATQERWFFESYSVPGGEAENQAPTDIRLTLDLDFAQALSGSNPNDKTPTGAIIGSLSAVDPDAGDTHSFQIVGGDDRFEIVQGDQLKLKDGAAISENDGTLEVTIEVTDSEFNTYYETFTFTAGSAGQGGPSRDNEISGTEASGDGQEASPVLGDDVIFGFRGEDTLQGGSGDDILIGGHGNDILIGGAGNDQLFGGNGSDTLIGGAGDDILWGGAGADTFKWMLNDQGSVDAPAVDTVMDFSKVEGDKIDLKDLLGGDAELLFTEVDGKAELHIATQGSGVDQKIVFDNASLADLQQAFGAADAASLVNHMIESGNLIVD